MGSKYVQALFAFCTEALGRREKCGYSLSDLRAKQSPRLLSRYQQQLLIASIKIELELLMHTMMGFSMARKSLRVIYIKIIDKIVRNGESLGYYPFGLVI